METWTEHVRYNEPFLWWRPNGANEARVSYEIPDWFYVYPFGWAGGLEVEGFCLNRREI